MENAGKRSAASAGLDNPPAKKARKKPVTAKSLGLTKEEFDSIKAPAHKRELKAIVKTLTEEVDADWHDGWEEQTETIQSWFDYIEKPLQAIIDLGIKKYKAFSHCQELLKIIEESFRDLCACPMRGTVKESCPESVSHEFDHPQLDALCKDEPFAWLPVWRVFLEVNANEGDVEESVMLRAIKDAHDAGVKLVGEDEQVSEKEEEISPYFRFVISRKSEWESLPNTLRTFRTRGCIDRRFDGSPSRRTR